jgi:hypothetical protein
VTLAATRGSPSLQIPSFQFLKLVTSWRHLPYWLPFSLQILAAPFSTDAVGTWHAMLAAWVAMQSQEVLQGGCHKLYTSIFDFKKICDCHLQIGLSFSNTCIFAVSANIFGSIKHYILSFYHLGRGCCDSFHNSDLFFVFAKFFLREAQSRSKFVPKCIISLQQHLVCV